MLAYIDKMAITLATIVSIYRVVFCVPFTFADSTTCQFTVASCDVFPTPL